MTPFRAAAAFAILLAGAGSAQAGTYYATVGGNAVDPTAFGGFDTAAGQNLSNWTANGGVTSPSTVGLVTSGVYNGTDALRVSDHSNSNSSKPNTAQEWTYVGLTSVTVAAGSLVTVSAEVAPARAGDVFGIVFGTSITSGTPSSGYYNNLSHSVATTPSSKWNLETFTFTAPSSTFDINFGFYFSTALTQNAGVTDPNLDTAYFDAVSIQYTTSDVPEPASLALLGAGLLGLGLARRRKHA